MKHNFIFAGLMMGLATGLSAQANENPSAKHKQAIQGVYLADVRSMLGDVEMKRSYGRYAIKGDSISFYKWNGQRKAWVGQFTRPYQLVYYYGDDYMSGYNIVFRKPTAIGDNEVRLCTGDVNGDGIMDLWCSDSLFYTKQ